MTDHIKQVSEGDPLSAEQMNQIISATNAKRNISVAGVSMNTSSEGVTFFPKAYDKFNLFELITEFVFPDLYNVETDHLSEDPTPTATARRLYLKQDDITDVDDEDDPVQSYNEDSDNPTFTIYAPQQFHTEITRSGPETDVGYAWGDARFNVGDRLLCGWNKNSGRWEVMAPAETLIKFELTGSSSYSFTPGDDADALFYGWNGSAYDPNDNVVIRVYDPIAMFSGTYSASGGGSRGWCKYSGTAGRWEIISPSSSPSGLQWATAQSDWVDASMDYVVCKRSDRFGTILDSTSFNVLLPTGWISDPAVYTGQSIPYQIDDAGEAVSEGTGSIRLGTVIAWHDTGALPTGLVDCDGSLLNAAQKKVARTHAPDATEGRVLAHTGDAAFDAQVGFKFHGPTENQHDQLNTFDQISGQTPGNILTDSGGDTMTSSQGEACDFNTPDTDNRPRTLISRFVFRWK